MKKIILLVLGIIFISSCGPSEEEKRVIREKQEKDSTDLAEKKFMADCSSLSGDIRSQLVKDGNYFMDYKTGTATVPEGCIWQIVNYNTIDNNLYHRQDVHPKFDRIKLNGDSKILYSKMLLSLGQLIGGMATCLNQTIIINNMSLILGEEDNDQHDPNNYNPIHEDIGNIKGEYYAPLFLPPGTKVCIPGNMEARFGMPYRSEPISQISKPISQILLSINQYKIKDPKLMENLKIYVHKKMGNHEKYVRHDWYNDPKIIGDENSFGLNLIAELSNNFCWYYIPDYVTKGFKEVIVPIENNKELIEYTNTGGKSMDKWYR